MKLAYPIILTPFADHTGGYTVEVPDLPGCVSEGGDLPEALFMAEDAASLWVLGELEAGRGAPEATDPALVRTERHGQIVSVVALDMDAYAQRYGNQAVRKNVTIPAWLDSWASREGVNYSHTLRDALEHRYRSELADA